MANGSHNPDGLSSSRLVSVVVASFSLLPYRSQSKALDVDSLYIVHVQCNRAPKQRRRTYRAHGRINRKCFIAKVLKRAGVMSVKYCPVPLSCLARHMDAAVLSESGGGRCVYVVHLGPSVTRKGGACRAELRRNSNNSAGCFQSQQVPFVLPGVGSLVPASRNTGTHRVDVVLRCCSYTVGRSIDRT